PGVEAGARLLAQLAGGDLVAQQLGRLEARPDRLREVLGDAEPYVETDEIRELERSHRVAVAELHRGVDIGRRRDALLHHANRLEPEHEAEPARREARAVLHRDRRLA